ncbi:hypothetical protein K1719_038468 [Acacia pycnantha]|nr:hypothetical protein K1719_038468 [Acacia pycnantha]
MVFSPITHAKLITNPKTPRVLANRRMALVVNLLMQELGIAKLSGFHEWLFIHLVIAGSKNASKMIIFAHHHKVLGRVQEFVCEKGISLIRIDGNTLARDRQLAVVLFRKNQKLKWQ